MVHPEGKIQLRLGEEISVPLDRDTELSITVHQFVTRRIREKQVDPVAAQRAQAVVSAPVRKPSVNTTQQPSAAQVQPAAPNTVKQPFEELYDYYSAKFPECGESVAAEEKATGKRVRIDMYAGDEKLLEHAAECGWIPKDFFEHSLLIHPDTRKTVFLGGAYLSRSGRLPFERTLGYSTADLGEEGQLACETALYYAAAVWLHRLLVGGYPLEGRATREMARQRGIGESAVLSEGKIAGSGYI